MPVELAIFDLDGTLLRGDTSCQTIARGLGQYERMREFESLTRRDEIIAARLEMADWYLAAGRQQVESHFSGLAWAPGAHEGMRMLANAGVRVALASVTWSFIVEHVARRFGAVRYVGTELDFASGEIRHAWGETKEQFLNDISEEIGVDRTSIAAVGDTSSDYAMLSASGVGIFVGEAAPPHRNLVHMPGADIRDVATAILEHP